MERPYNDGAMEQTQTTDKKKVKMQLVGIDGNAFSVMGNFQQNARRQGWSNEEINEVIDKAMSGDYDNLLATIMDHTES
jgi:hypothetical protein